MGFFLYMSSLKICVVLFGFSFPFSLEDFRIFLKNPWLLKFYINIHYCTLFFQTQVLNIHWVLSKQIRTLVEFSCVISLKVPSSPWSLFTLVFLPVTWLPNPILIDSLIFFYSLLSISLSLCSIFREISITFSFSLSLYFFIWAHMFFIFKSSHFFAITSCS